MDWLTILAIVILLVLPFATMCGLLILYAEHDDKFKIVKDDDARSDLEPCFIGTALFLGGPLSWVMFGSIWFYFMGRSLYKLDPTAM